MILVIHIVLAIILLLFFCYVILVYNDIISLQNYVKKNWSNIDVTLKQRSNVVPNLVAVVKEYLEYEKTVLQSIADARSSLFKASSTTKKAIASDELSGALKSLFAVAEKHPDLKANRNVLQLQKRITLLENIIADRRKLFNESVMNYNIKIKRFPDVILATILRIKPYENFTADKDEKNAISVKL